MALNTELFIEIVQKHQVLYDTSHRDYKNLRIKNKIWDKIAEMFEESNGDTLKNRWKNLRDAYSKHLRFNKTNTGQASKLLDRYKAWPWAKLMSFLRPHLEYAETHLNIERNAEEVGCAQSINRQRYAEEADTYQLTNTSTPINTAQSQPDDLSQPQQNDTPQHIHTRSRRKRTLEQSQSQVDKVINFLSQNTEQDDDTDLLFKSYAKKLKKMTARRQATVKFEIAKVMLNAELEESDEMQPRSDVGKHIKNNMKIEHTSSSPDTN